MDAFSSGEDLLIKTRKPYTITKQRERWTDEEHSRFLEALKLYGRAWQKIEEHIGTKTAVQIRSHAQKFFSKLEKEAVAKGVPVAQALDIDIPPPRPKRKPSNPYPRKSSVSSITCQVGATKDDGKLSASLPCPPNQVLDLEKEPPPEKPSGDEKSTGAKENHDDNCSEVFTSSSSIFSLKQKAHGGLSNPCSFREFVPCLKDVVSQDKSQVTTTLDGNKKWHNPDLTPKVYENGSNSKALLLGKANVNAVGLPEDKMQSTQNCPRHVPVHILDGSTLAESQGRSDVYSLSTASAAEVQKNMAGAASSTNQPFPPFPHPFTPSLHSQDDYRSFLQMSSTFSSLVASTLLQNPAAHAAATFAASFWPYANIGNATDSSGGLSTRQLNSAPSMAAIAAATVAAATAWWAAHGILPMCSAHQTAFDCLPPAYNDPFSVANMESEENKEGALEHPPSDAAQAQISVPKSPTVSSSESGENGSAKPDGSPEAADHEMNATVPEVHNCSEPKNRKQADRSSCGSNTASSSEVETDALEKNGNEGNEELKEPDGPNLPAATDSSTRRILRSNGGMAGDSWKSVSQVGRRAFQALFSREKLPQSFSPPQDGESEGVHRDGVEMQNADEKNGEATAIDLNNEAWCLYRDESNAASINHDECFPTIGIENGKPKARRMGFKPYKRCSMEAKENMLTGPGEEKESKRIRLGVERGDSI